MGGFPRDYGIYLITVYFFVCLSISLTTTQTFSKTRILTEPESLTEIEMMENRLMRDIGLECCSALKAGKSFSGNIIRDVRSFPCLSSLLMAHTPVHHQTASSASERRGGAGCSFILPDTHHFRRCEHFTKIATVIDDDDGDRETD